MKPQIVNFHSPGGPTLVVMDQTHLSTHSDGTTTHTAKLTIEEPTSSSVILELTLTKGQKAVDGRFTLTIGETKRLAGYLEKALDQIAQQQQYGEDEKKRISQTR